MGGWKCSVESIISRLATNNELYGKVQATDRKRAEMILKSVRGLSKESIGGMRKAWRH